LTPTRTRRLLTIQPAADGGGSETALVCMLAQLASEGWECHVALPGPARLAAEYAAAGATVHVVAMERVTTQGDVRAWAWRYARRWPATVLRLALLARRCRADVVHSNSLHSWYGWTVAALLRRPHVWHAREVVVQSGAALAVERFLARHFAVAVLATSRYVASQLDPANVVVAVDAPAAGAFGPERAGAFRAGAGIGDGVALVGSVARVDTWKGFGVLLDAAPLIREARPDVELVVAGAPVGGKEAYAEDLERRARELGFVHWLGPRSDVGELMADLDVFAQVSTSPEPFGLVHVEALASGVPVVAGDVGGPVEILAGLGPDAGALVPAGDPEALARAVVALLPDGASSTSTRRRRPPRRPLAAADFGALFAAAASGRNPTAVAGGRNPTAVASGRNPTAAGETPAPGGSQDPRISRYRAANPSPAAGQES
jgi:glycosyltransferase involved in cell wall biosynthesis